MQALLDAITKLQSSADTGRVFHGRGGLYPGCEQWALDFFPPVWLLTSFLPVEEEKLEAIGRYQRFAAFLHCSARRGIASYLAEHCEGDLEP